MVQRHEHDIEALRELGWAEVRVREENLAHFNGPVEPKAEKDISTGASAHPSPTGGHAGSICV